MHGDVKSMKRTKTGKRFFMSISCLVLLSLNLFSLTCAAGLGMEESGGGFDNPIDDCYPSALYYGDGSGAKDILEAYEAAWQNQLSDYVEYEAGNGNMTDKGAAEEYMNAVLNAVCAQKNLMEYMGVDQEEILWYSAQIYRHAFIKDIKGEFTDGPWREGQESFDINWSNELCRLTMEFYEGLDQEGKRLAGIWQESRENWKKASNEYFWSLRGENDAKKREPYAVDKEVFEKMVERDGWINRLYFLQLQRMEDPDTGG